MPSSPTDQGQCAISLPEEPPEEPIRQRYGDQVQVSTLWMESIDRAVTDNAADGFIKAAHRSNETVLGATVVESQAAGTSRDWSIAAARGLERAMWRRHIHPQPRATTNCLGRSPGGLTQRLAGRALR